MNKLSLDIKTWIGCVLYTCEHVLLVTQLAVVHTNVAQCVKTSSTPSISLCDMIQDHLSSSCYSSRFLLSSNFYDSRKRDWLNYRSVISISNPVINYNQSATAMCVICPLTKWMESCWWRFTIHFLDRNVCILIQISLNIGMTMDIVSREVLAWTIQQANTWTNNNPVHERINDHRAPFTNMVWLSSQHG